MPIPSIAPDFCLGIFEYRVNIRRHMRSRKESSDTRGNHLTQLRLSR